MADLAADVALRPRLNHQQSAVFSYSVPPALQPSLEPGQLVWVPLRNQLVQGVVLKLYPASERASKAYPLRNIDDIADPEVQIPPAGLALAQWLTDTYQFTLYSALALLLPPGVNRHAETTWHVTTAGRSVSLGSLPEHERAVLYYLRRHTETTEAELERQLKSSKARLREACLLLKERGLIERGTVLSARRVRPKAERLARLLFDPNDAESLADTLTSLQRAPRQRAVVEWLAQIDAPETELTTLYAATGANLVMLRSLAEKGVLTLEEREVRRDPLAATDVPPDNPPPLTPGQRRVWEPLSAALDNLRHQQTDQSPPKPFLLHGVTGSGKTEVYLRAVARALRHGRQALVLVPEIALTTQLVRRFAARFPGQVAVLHSHLTTGERYDEWRRLQRGEARLAIGSRSAVFAPLPELGLIIVDEEHEPGYKHDGNPRYHARDIALQLARLTNSLLILGSATPSVESYYATQTGQMQLLTMPERVGSMPGPDGLPRTQPLPLPRVRLVDMRQELQLDNRSIFSEPLQAALHTILERNEQAILFLNRRGAATFVMCRDCGYVLKCPRCNGSLVVHYAPRNSDQAADGEREPLLICHSCSYSDLVPAFCPNCLSPRIKSFGVGTQKVEEEVLQLFPQAHPLRWDQDSIHGKGAHDRMLDQFLSGAANVLIGTQMIAKGLDLPRVSLVGVVAADTGLYLPDFRSGERTFQLLTQVAGRAGRRTAGAQVIIQTYTPEHYALQAAQEHDYHSFYIQEIAFRRQTRYPPFGRLVRFVYSSTSQLACERETTALAARLQTIAHEQRLTDWSLIGPAPAFFQRLRGRWRWHLLLRINDPAQVLALLGPLPGWTIDIDPVQVL